ncbi:MAG: hypothetical protein JKY34_04740 [Kordiimonadaceae bacterium]|nr:hypothetical protein [Kordiimonadaceae bacterium]
MRQLKVAILKDETPFLNGAFDVSDEDYPIVVGLLKEVDMTKAQAASLLSGYMHAKDVGPISEDMGKLAMIAAVFMLEAGEVAIEIPLETDTA